MRWRHAANMGLEILVGPVEGRQRAEGWGAGAREASRVHKREQQQREGSDSEEGKRPACN